MFPQLFTVPGTEFVITAYGFCMGLALVGACTVADADPQASGSTGGSTDGLGQSKTSASDPTAPGDTNAPTNPGTDDDL